MKLSNRCILPSLFVLALYFTPSRAFGETITWTLSDVIFTNGVTASGSFEYNPDSGLVSNIDITSAETTFTELDPAFPVKPYEFAFVPAVPLTYGAKVPALFFTPAPGLTDAGGTVPLYGLAGGYPSFSIRGVECDDACDGITTSQQIESGALIASLPSAVPEPNFAMIDALAVLAIAGIVNLRKGTRGAIDFSA